MFNVYVNCTIFKVMVCSPSVLSAGVTTQNETHPQGCAQFRCGIPMNRVRRFDAGPNWDISEVVHSDVKSQTEPLSQFVWNKAIYRARKAVKNFSE